MKGRQLSRQLLDAMAYIDDALIEEAAPLPENKQADTDSFTTCKRYNWKGIAACAAVFAVAVVSLWVWNSSIVLERDILDKGQSAGAYDTGVIPDDDITLENAPVDLAAAKPAQNQDVMEDTAVLNDGGLSGAAILDDVSADTEAVEEANHKEGDCEKSVTGVIEESEERIVRVIEEFPVFAEYCYAVPEKGNCLICAGLEAAIDYYDYANNTVDIAVPESYLYHVTIQVFEEMECDDETGDDKNGSSMAKQMAELASFEEGKEKLYQEYERMLSIGLDVSLSEDYELTGVLNHEEIESFVLDPEYSYVFRLVNEN